ncbi:MAG: TM0106 family RecB-like putative nuclease [Gemmatimonadota bacterium]
MTDFRPSDFYDYLRPSPCELRVWLRRRGEPEAEPGPFDALLYRLGELHEANHLRTLREEIADVVDLSDVPREEREDRTLDAVRRGAAVIYQGTLVARHVVDGFDCRIAGAPDFLIQDGLGYRIRDSKLARRVGLRAAVEEDGAQAAEATPEPEHTGEEPGGGDDRAKPGTGRRRRARKAPRPHHPEIVLQLQIYGWMYEQTFGVPPAALEVHAGTDEIVPIPYDRGAAALETMARMIRIAAAQTEPREPVGWSKCQGCGYRGRCWPAAEQRRDVSLIPRLRQDRAKALMQAGVLTLDDLLARFDEDGLAALELTIGGRTRRFGPGAGAALRSARALTSGATSLLSAPGLPEVGTWVMFDVEGLPAYLDELEKVYLWGLQAFGDRPGPFMPALAGLGGDGDRAGWEAFLSNARALLDDARQTRFVHWGTYEKTKLKSYVARYGDSDGTAARVETGLLDLCALVARCFVLPLSSYSLKQVERFVGFERRLEYAGDLAMADYIQAVETQDPARREALISRIVDYNAEDLAATWAVLQWVRGRTAPAR